MSALLPCPFCGGEAETFGPYGWYSQWGISHSCKTFYSGSGDMCKGLGSEAAAIAAWNTRVEHSALKALEDIVNAQGDAFEEAAAIERAELLLNKVRSNG